MMRVEVWMETPNRAHVMVPMIALAVGLALTADVSQALANTHDIVALAGEHVVSHTYDGKIWPIIMDVGNPVAKTMMAVGMYRMMQNDTTGGWQKIYRAGLGLFGLHAINLIVHLIDGAGAGFDAI